MSCLTPQIATRRAAAADSEPAFFGGEYIVFSAQYPDGQIVTINAFSRHRAVDCPAQAQAVLTNPF